MRRCAQTPASPCHGTRVEPLRGSAALTMPCPAGGSIDSRHAGGEFPAAQARFSARTAARCTATSGRCVLPCSWCLASVFSMLAVTPFCCCYARATTEDAVTTEQSNRRSGSRTIGSCVARRAARPFVTQAPRCRAVVQGACSSAATCAATPFTAASACSASCSTGNPTADSSGPSGSASALAIVTTPSVPNPRPPWTTW